MITTQHEEPGPIKGFILAGLLLSEPDVPGRPDEAAHAGEGQVGDKAAGQMGQVGAW